MTPPADEEIRAHRELARRVARPRRPGAILGGLALAVLSVPCFFVAAMLTMGDPAGLPPSEYDAFMAEKQAWALVARGCVLVGLLSLTWAIGWAVRAARYRFHAPSTWPAAPPGWRPPRGWTPPPTWPDPPEGWRFWR